MAKAAEKLQKSAAKSGPTSALPQNSLAFALTGAALALAQVDAGTSLPRALADLFRALRPLPASRGAIQDLAYRGLRHWAVVKTVRASLLDAPPKPARLGALIGVALALLIDEDRPYTEHAVVDQAVSACAADRELGRAKGLVNAVLRRFLRERESLLIEARASDTVRWNYPQWWIDKARHDWPDHWEALLTSGHKRSPLTLRVNRRKTTTDDYLSLLKSAEIDATRIGESAIRLAQPMSVSEIPGFADGWVSVQDAAAQLAAPLLDLSAGMRVLDACAAPGGKTGHLLETADIDLLALDHDPERLKRVVQNLERLSLNAQVRVGDARRRDWWDERAFDRILADVPCTASGIVRRHPDIPWLRRPSDSAELARLSSEILDNLWQMLRPGGKLLIVTCSVWPEESALQAQAFAERHRALRLGAPGQLLPSLSAVDDHDGLFYALLQKPLV